MDYQNKDNGLANGNIPKENGEKKNFYQKLAMSSLNEDAPVHTTSSYFDTLQHKAGIQPTRKNGYYIKQDETKNIEQEKGNEKTETKNELDDLFNIEKVKKENFMLVEEEMDNKENSETPIQLQSSLSTQSVPIQQAPIQQVIPNNVQNSCVPNSHVKNQNIEDIFAFQETNVEREITAEEFYNDYLASDDEIDKRNEQEYIRAIETHQQQMKQGNFSQVNAYVSNGIKNTKQYVKEHDNKVNNEKNQIIIVSSCIVCFVILLIVLIVIAVSNTFPKNDKQNIDKSLVSGNSPVSIEQTLREKNEVVCFSVKEINFYSDSDLLTIAGTIDRYEAFAALTQNINERYIKVDKCYINSNDVYVYNGTLDEFKNESISYFERYDEKFKTVKELYLEENKEIEKENQTTTEEENSTEDNSLGVNNNEQTIEDSSYTLNKDELSVPNISLLGGIENNLVKPSSKTVVVDMYNGVAYGNLVINSVNIDTKIYYGAHQENIDKYDVCSHSNYFGIPGSNRPILMGGHNYKAFANLLDVSVGDIIEIKTSYGEFKYEVFYVGIGKVVTENIQIDDYLKDISTGEEIFSSKGNEEILGLYTCYDYGNSDQPTNFRYAVKAKKIYAKFN